MPWLTFWPWRWWQYIPLKYWRTPTRLHNVTSQKTVLVIITANFKSSMEGTASPPFKLAFRDSGESETEEWIHVTVSLPWPTQKSLVPCCFNPDTTFKFALFLKRNLNAWLWTFYGNTKNNEACPASAVIWWVLFVTLWCMGLFILLVIQVSAAWLFMRNITLFCLGVWAICGRL
jgi:hypothetical protein